MKKQKEIKRQIDRLSNDGWSDNLKYKLTLITYKNIKRKEFRRTDKGRRQVSEKTRKNQTAELKEIKINRQIKSNINKTKSNKIKKERFFTKERRSGKKKIHKDELIR